MIKGGTKEWGKTFARNTHHIRVVELRVILTSVNWPNNHNYDLLLSPLPPLPPTKRPTPRNLSTLGIELVMLVFTGPVIYIQSSKLIDN